MRVIYSSNRRRRRSADRSLRSQRGFTLVELLVVMGLLALLVAIALPRFSGARRKAHRSAMQSDLHNLASAQEAYFDANYGYASDISQLEFNQSSGVTIQVTEAVPSGWSALATHTNTTAECGIYTGLAAPVAGVPDLGEGVISCTEAP